MIENKQVLYTEDIPFSAFNKKYIIKRLKELRIQKNVKEYF